MPSSNASDYDASPANSKIPTNTTPRRSAAIKRSSATPKRNTSGNKLNTPRSAPVRVRSGTKKSEPTLLGDFLLGRPSSHRSRRRSLDGVKAEMKEAAINRIRSPGGVRDRVKQWQKASAAAVVEDLLVPASEPDDALLKAENETVGEEDRQRIKCRKQELRPGRRKSQENRQLSPDLGRTKLSPKKRVVSDDHWMKKKSPRGTPDIKLNAGSPLPKDFLTNSTLDPPLEKKLEDWAKRTAGEDRTSKDRHGRNSLTRNPAEDGIRVYPSRSPSADGGLNESTSRKPSIDDGIRVKAIKSEGRRKAYGSQHDLESQASPRRQSANYLPPYPDVENTPRNRKTSRGRMEDTPPPSWTTPSPPYESKMHKRKSKSPESFAEVPVGYSAFSMLELPVGADAKAIRQQRPQRTPSLSAVPKVLKKVYSEGLKIVHETVDPSSNGVNQPPSIESWLNGTSDPFIEQPANPDSIVQAARRHRRQVYAEDHESVDMPTLGSLQKCEGVEDTSRRRVLTPQRQEDEAVARETKESSKPPKRNVQEDVTPPVSPSSLRRVPATRNTSTSKSTKRSSFRESFVEAFRGDSEPQTSRKLPIRPTVTFDTREEQNDQTARDKRINLRPHDRDHENRTLTDQPLSRNTPELDNTGLHRDRHCANLVQRSNGRCDAPTIGQHRLSTIASVETFETSTFLTEASSELSQISITQTTVSQNTAKTSNTSYTGGTQSGGTRQRSNPYGLKRRLTKHSDLLSVLSLPNAPGTGRSRSIRSARSVRTTRSHLATATLPSLLQELADDEVKYMRELKTLVDGVIPVLLTSVLSKSESAITAGFSNPTSNGRSDGSITKPIVDMGISLERLKSIHRRTPIHDADQLIHWAAGAHKVYDDYLNAWCMGFQDVIVNLAPASPSDENESLLNGGMPRNAAGDVLNEEGERVDVAFLLKRPLVRIKYLSKVLKGIVRLQSSEVAVRTNDKFLGLVERTRIRIKEEGARLEDQAANNTDATRARDPRNLAPLDGVIIDRTRQVSAKDFFDLDIPHSSGQRIGCRVEFLLRDKPKDDADPGDILICEVDHLSRWLLFPPIELHNISAHLGDEKTELVVMIRGPKTSDNWYELLMLTAESEETAQDWFQMLGSTPLPPQIDRYKLSTTASHLLVPSAASIRDDRADLPSRWINSDEAEIPIGETRRRKTHSRRASSISSKQPFWPRYGQEIAQIRSDLSSNSGIERCTRSQSPLTSTAPRTRTSLSDPKSSAVYSNEVYPATHNDRKAQSPVPHSEQSHENPIRKKRKDSGSDETRISPRMMEYDRNDDSAPTPPVHKSPGPVNAKNAPVLDSKASRFNNRRSSSPLKHEYQPSHGSVTSSESEDSDSLNGMMDLESSDEEELEAVEPHVSISAGTRLDRKVSPAGSINSLPNSSLAPSQSVSQSHFRGGSDDLKSAGIRLVASISCWSEKGHWKDLHPDDCSIVVGPGNVEAFVLSASNSGSWEGDVLGSSARPDVGPNIDTGTDRPLVALELTPCVPLRQSNALDIEIRSPPTGRSTLKCTHTVRFRSRTLQECSILYAAIHEARMNNPVYKRLEQERIVGAYGGQSYQAAVGGNRRVSWFSRRKSYRASARAPSATVSDNSSSSFSSAIARLKNIGGTGGFNIAKSSIASHQGPGAISGSTSPYTSSSESGVSGLTPPGTSSSPSIALTGKSNVASLGRSNLKIRLYVLETSSKWNELGCAVLTISEPPPGMRQASSLYHGIEKRVIVTSDSKRSLAYTTSRDSNGEASHVVIDQVLGGKCFSRLGVVGIAMNIWEDIMGDNGEIGMIAAIGGVSGRTRKWMFQCATAKEASWIFSLVGGGGP